MNSDELKNAPFIACECGSGTRIALERALELIDASLAGFNVTLELTNNEAVKAVALHGAGVSVLSRRVVSAS